MAHRQEFIRCDDPSPARAPCRIVARCVRTHGAWGARGREARRQEGEGEATMLSQHAGRADDRARGRVSTLGADIAGAVHARSWRGQVSQGKTQCDETWLAHPWHVCGRQQGGFARRTGTRVEDFWSRSAFPAVHPSHSDFPAGANSPTSHRVHSDAPSRGEKKPAIHVWQYAPLPARPALQFAQREYAPECTPLARAGRSPGLSAACGAA